MRKQRNLTLYIIWSLPTPTPTHPHPPAQQIKIQLDILKY